MVARRRLREPHVARIAGELPALQRSRDGFTGAMIVAAGLALLGALAGTTLPARRTHRASAAVVGKPVLEGEGGPR